MKILLVDHQFERVRSIRTILSSLGHKASDVENIENGAEAFKGLKRARFDVVIVALDAKGMDGLTFVNEVRASVSLRRIPVILIATHPSRDNIRDAGEAQVSGFLVHPCSIDDIENVLEKVVGKK